MSVLNRSSHPSAVSVAPIIVHSHLRWDFVWQRPQQILTRLAAHTPVFFLEEPIFLDDVAEPSLDVTLPHVNVYRAIPRLPGSFRSDPDAAVAEVRTLALAKLNGLSALHGLFRSPVQWFYTPMPAPAMLGAFDEIGVVYDCMDELSQFRFAHPDLVRREQMLMDHADVIFTGGHKLYEAKAKHHHNVHFFGCGVDARHFARARDPLTPLASDMASIPAPIAGYYGVIDERLDYELIAQTAARDPRVQVVMVGPTVKVDPAELPQAPNIYWLGTRSYDDLPSYVKGFDVCLMPFALNGATEYINPTKTLEYLAAGKPVVSTAVPDVLHNFSSVVRVARDGSSFVDAVVAEIRHPDHARSERGIAVARSASWESVVSSMRTLVTEAITRRPSQARVRAHIGVTRAAERVADHGAEAVPEMHAGAARASA